MFEEDQILEVAVCGKYKNYGKSTVDLNLLSRECTHKIWTSLDECNADVLLMLTISGTTASETISDLNTYKDDPREIAAMLSRYVRNIFSYIYFV